MRTKSLDADVDVLLLSFCGYVSMCVCVTMCDSLCLCVSVRGLVISLQEMERMDAVVAKSAADSRMPVLP